MVVLVHLVMLALLVNLVDRAVQHPVQGILHLVGGLVRALIHIIPELLALAVALVAAMGLF